MIISKTKYELEKLKYEQRISYLEHLICPNESHEYKKIDFHFEGGTGRGDETTIYHYVCTKCRKYRETYKILD